MPTPLPSIRATKPELTSLLHLYVERFNRRDWDGLRELISADARLRVADRFIGTFAESEYFGNYERWPGTWRMAVGHVDGNPVVIIYVLEPSGWTPMSLVDVEVTNQQITNVRDYFLAPWVLSAARSTELGEVS